MNELSSCLKKKQGTLTSLYIFRLSSLAVEYFDARLNAERIQNCYAGLLPLYRSVRRSGVTKEDGWMLCYTCCDEVEASAILQARGM